MGVTYFTIFFQEIREHNLSKTTVDLIRSIIGRGVDVNAKDRNGENPLHVLCKFCTNEETLLSLVQVLKENGIDLSAKTKEDYPARYIYRETNQRLNKVINPQIINELNF